MTDRYEKIREALAKGPTPGPWLEVHHEGSRWTDIYQDGGQRYATPIVYVPPLSSRDENGIWKENKDETAANVKYIAACDPDTIRELLEERDALRKALDQIEQQLDTALHIIRAALKEASND